MVSRREIVEAATQYLRRNPQEIARAFRSALGLRVGIPMPALRWFAEQATKSGKVSDVELESVPPGARVAATVDLMKTAVRASGVLFIERIRITNEEIRIELRVEQLALKLIDSEAVTPVAALIKSGALDLSKPGTLARNLSLPPFVLDARDNKFVLDLMRIPKVRDNENARKIIDVVTSLIGVYGVETETEHVDVHLRAFPSGLFHAATTLGRKVVAPSLKRVSLFLPGRD